MSEQPDRLTRGEIVAILFKVPPCPDGEPGRACRWCEGEALYQWLTYGKVPASDE